MSTKHSTHRLEREDFGPLTVVRFKTQTLHNDDDTRAIFDHIYGLVDDVGRTQILLNFGTVDYLASLALGKLVMLNRKVLGAGGRLALCNLQPPVREVLELTHLNDLFNIYGDEAEVARSFVPDGGDAPA
jgi:anti-anti-sigma factor